jgi:hypothetical protein
MKEKKGKKSLRDLDNLVVKRSTGLKELSKTVSNNSLGTSSVSISTTSSSDLPPSKYISGTNSDYSSLNFCAQLGKYEEYCYNPKTTYFLLDRFFVNLEVQDNEGQGNQKGVGWRLNITPKDWSNIVPGAPPRGYLFVYFYNSFDRSNCTTGNSGELGDKVTGGVCSNVESGKPNSRNFFQGSIFAVVISKISQINALNRTLGADSNGSYLSSKINDTKDIKYTMILDPTDFYVRNFINDIRKRNNNDTTPIISPINPIEWNGTIFDINFNSYESYPSEYGGTSIYINLKDLVTSDKFVNGLMGSGIFTVNRLAGVNGYFTPTLNTFNSYKPKIISSSILNINANELSVFDDTTYVQIMKPPTSVSTGFYQPRFLNFTLLLTQPFYYTTGELFYTEKTIVLGFRVIF